MSSPAGYEEHLGEIYFDALKGNSYHKLREKFFTRRNRIAIASSIATGAISVIIVYTTLSNDAIAILFSLAAFMIGVVSFTSDFTGNVENHRMLSHRWKYLAEALDDKRIGKESVEKEDYKILVKEYNKIIRDEDAIIYKGLDAVAHNAALRMHKYGKAVPIPWSVNLFKNWYPFPNFTAENAG